MFLHKFAGLLNLKIKLTALVCKQVGLMNFYMGKNTAIFFPIFWDIPKIIKFKATNSLRVSCLFCIFKHSPQKTV